MSRHVYHVVWKRVREEGDVACIIGGELAVVLDDSEQIKRSALKDVALSP